MLKDTFIFITTSPRKNNFLDRSLVRINNLGIDNEILIFSEPGSFESTHKNTVQHYHEKKLGLFENFSFSLEYAIETNRKYILALQDDVYLGRHFINHFNFVFSQLANRENFGSASFFLAEHNAASVQIGWNRHNLGHQMWGAQCLLFTNESAKKLLNSECWKERRKNQQKGTDYSISLCMKEIDLEQWIHKPSLVRHIGNESTVDHDRSFKKNKGYGFS